MQLNILEKPILIKVNVKYQKSYQKFLKKWDQEINAV